jgi:hypothetical protein
MDACAVLDVLALARAFVEAGWTQRFSARDRHGLNLMPTDNEAVRFCVAGALGRATYELEPPEAPYLSLLSHVCWEKHGELLHVFNDSPGVTHDEVLALFDAAAARVGKG